jgi:hypothetical protein
MEREPVSASTENGRPLLGELRMRSVLIDIGGSDRWPPLHFSRDPSQQRVSVHWDIGASLGRTIGADESTFLQADTNVTM